jgi:hypothetical protein
MRDCGFDFLFEQEPDLLDPRVPRTQDGQDLHALRIHIHASSRLTQEGIFQTQRKQIALRLPFESLFPGSSLGDDGYFAAMDALFAELAVQPVLGPVGGD